VVRLKGVLTAAEQHLVKSLPVEKGRDLLKHVRTYLIETARPAMEVMVHKVTAVKVLTLHDVISTVTDEEVVLFTPAKSPMSRETRNDRRATHAAVQPGVGEEIRFAFERMRKRTRCIENTPVVVRRTRHQG